jgi:transcriptional regulator with XRE-family HTH domain
VIFLKGRSKMRLKELRLSKGLTQSEVAKVIGYSSLSYARYEKGEREPDINTLCKLADYFEVSVDYLIARTVQENFLEGK